MEQVMLFDTGEDTDIGSAHRLTERVNDWLREQGDKIIVTHRQVTSDSEGFPIVWIFYAQR